MFVAVSWYSPMNAVPAGLLVVAAAYLIGSLPFGYLTARFVAGIDIRKQGSGNIGATNVARVLGTKLGVLVLVLDCLKGLLPVWLLPGLFNWFAGGSAEATSNHVRVACGVATIVGHMFPVWLRFRGGKGVATALGVALMLSWAATLSAAVVFSLVFAASRIVSLSSMLAAVGFAASHFFLATAPFSRDNCSLTAFSLAVPVLILLRHRGNVARLWRGEEKRFSAKAAAEAEPGDGAKERRTGDAGPEAESPP